GPAYVLALARPVLFGSIRIPHFELETVRFAMHRHPFDRVAYAAWCWWPLIGIGNWPCGQFQRVYPIHRSVCARKTKCRRAQHDRTPLGLFDDAIAHTKVIKRVVWHQVCPSAQSIIEIIEAKNTLQGLELVQLVIRHSV